MEEYVLRVDWTFHSSSRRKKSYLKGSKLFVEVEVLSTQSEPKIEFKNYYIYSELNRLIGHFDESDFFETFMTIEEDRNRKIDDII